MGDDVSAVEPLPVMGTEADTEQPPRVSDVELAELVNEYSEPIFRVARSIVRDHALAEDVVQETLVKVWRNLHTFRGEGSLRSWILRIAHNQAVSTLRRIKDEARDPALLPEEMTSSSGVASEVVARKFVDELGAQLESLDELTRSIVVLREVEGLSYEEISDALGVALPTVKTRLFRARKLLIQRMKAWQ